MAEDDELDWLARLYEEQGSTLHRLVVLLGAEPQSGRIVRTALLALHRRGHRLIDPAERVEFLQEQVVHLAHSVRSPTQRLDLPEVTDPRQEEILSALSLMDPRAAEIIVVSHYLSVFGPELAGIMRLSVRGCNQRLETALETLRRGAADPTPSVPGALESLSQEVTAALRSAARTIQAPGTETLSSELLELGQHSSSRVGMRTVAVSCLVAVTLGLGLAVATGASTNPSPSPEPVSESTTVAVEARSIPAQVQHVPLYYLGRQDGKLYCEFRDLPATGNLLHSGLENLFTLASLDPGYRSGWGRGGVNDIELTGDVLTVDLTAEAYEALTMPDEAQAAIDQLVYTATDIAGLPDLKVYFLSDGATPPPLFFSASGFGRYGLAPMAPVWINSPRDGAQVPAGEITLSGSAQPEAGVPVVTVANIETGQVVASATAQTATVEDDDGWRPWSVTVRLDPGSYEVKATVDYGEPLRTVIEDKSISVIER